MFARQVLAALLVVLLAFPAWSNPGIVGTASASKAATVRGAALQPGSTLFSGDTIDVGPQGGAWIALEGGSGMQVAANSQVHLATAGDATQFEIGRGRVTFRIRENSLQARLADATIRASGRGPAVGVISLDGRKAFVAAEKGELLVATAASAKSVILHEGEGVEMTLEPAPAPQFGSGASAKTLSGKWVVLLGAVVAGIIIAVAVARNRAETKLTDQEKKNEVSPFRFP